MGRYLVVEQFEVLSHLQNFPKINMENQIQSPLLNMVKLALLTASVLYYGMLEDTQLRGALNNIHERSALIFYTLLYLP